MSDSDIDPVEPDKRDDPTPPLPSEIESAASSSDPPDPVQPPDRVEPPVEPTTGTAVALSKEEKYWAAALHGSAGAGLLFHFASIPFLNIIAPLVIWLIKKDEMPFVRSQGKEVLNFQISWTLYGLGVALVIGVIGVILMLVLVGVFILWALAILASVYAVVMAVMSIIGAVNAADGKHYKYPATIKFIK